MEKLLFDKDFKNMTSSEKKDYYEELRKQCLLIEDHQPRFCQDLIKRVYPFLRNYKLEIQGEENIPKDTPVLFLVNHSNSHDVFTAYEVLSVLKRRGSVMVSTDCLNPLTTGLFRASNATLLDRRIKEERNSSVLRMSRKVVEGIDGVVFGESTWNLHPTLPMHNIRQGISKISAITQVPIIPVIFEYIENEGIISKEGNLYKKCIIRFGRPHMINHDYDLISQTNILRDEMIKMRTQIWNNNNINKSSIRDIDPLLYVNNIYLKKFKALGFALDSKQEQEYLLFLENEPRENEYTLNSEGILVPGITEKDSNIRKLLRK